VSLFYSEEHINIANMSSTASFHSTDKVERADHLERQRAASGHIADSSQPVLPVYHRKLANPTPLSLLSFATEIFFISCIGVNTRGVATSNMLIAVMIFYGGIAQYSETVEH
jgi:succinate-acetate transporter protein